MYGCFDASREPRSNPSTGENGSREGQVVHRCSMATLPGKWKPDLRVEVSTTQKQHPLAGLPIGMYDKGVSPSRREMVNTQVRGVHTRS